MKKYFWIVAFIWGWSVSAYADSIIGFGFKGGFVIAGQSMGPLASNEISQSLFGPTGGIFTDFQPLDLLSFQLEANYIQKGSGFNLTNVPVTSSTSPFIIGTTTVKVTSAYDYLEVPLLIKLQTNLAPGLQGYLLAGPSIAFLLNQTLTVTAAANGPVTYSSTSQTETQYYPNTDWSLNFGAGLEYKGILCEIRYELGLDSASPTADTNRTTGQNNALSFQAGIKLF